MTILKIVSIVSKLLIIERFEFGVCLMAKKIKENKKIIICCDGTNNKPSAGEATNIYDLVGLLNGTQNQIVFYDPGVGAEPAPGFKTKTAKLFSKGLGLAIGYGLNQNIKDAYEFLMDNYVPGDKIYIFGFSRGAYTARALVGMLHLVGLLKPGSRNLLDYAIANYTNQGKIDWENTKSFQSRLCQQIVIDGKTTYQIPIEFLGIWDTVKSIGIFRHSVTLPFTRRLPNVKTVRHAIAFDEKRSKYRPNHITAIGRSDGSVQSMWFKGVHSDIGGGYKATERGLSDHTMEWMIEAAQRCQLSVQDGKLQEYIGKRKKEAGDSQKYYKKHNSLLVPPWFIIGWLTRELPARYWVHQTAIKNATDRKPLIWFLPFRYVPEMGRLQAVIKKDEFVMQLHGNLLVQKLTPQEQQLLNDVPDDALEAQKLVLLAGIQCWQDRLDEAISTEELKLKETRKEKANALLDKARTAIEADQYKGLSGAYGAIEDFINMSSLEKGEKGENVKDHIIATAPHVMETLAENIA